MFDPDIAAYYELGLEDARLGDADEPRLEFVRTMELLDRFLPPAPARVADVGGGTGVYLVALAALGHQVHLVDPVEGHVDTALERIGVAGAVGCTAQLGDARDLPFETGSLDAAVLLGPLYHLVSAADRQMAWSEAVRVVRPGGVVAGAAISRFAPLLDGIKQGWLGDPDFRVVLAGSLADGQHRNPFGSERPEFFTTAYMHLPAELSGEASAVGLTDVRVLPVEGPGWLDDSPGSVAHHAEAARRVENEPSLLGATSHLLAVGTVPG